MGSDKKWTKKVDKMWSDEMGFVQIRSDRTVIPFFVVEKAFKGLKGELLKKPDDTDTSTPPFKFYRWPPFLTGKHESNLASAGCSCSRGLPKKKKKKGNDGGAMCTSRVIIPLWRLFYFIQNATKKFNSTFFQTGCTTSL